MRYINLLTYLLTYLLVYRREREAVDQQDLHDERVVRAAAERDVAPLRRRHDDVRHVGVHVLLLRRRVQRQQSCAHLLAPGTAHCRRHVDARRQRRLRHRPSNPRITRPARSVRLINASAYRPLSAQYIRRKSLTSLQFDVVCCSFIYGRERRSLCAKRVIN